MKPKTAKAASNPEVNQYLKEAGILPGNASLGPIGPNEQWVALKKDMVTAAIKAGVKPLVQLISAMPSTSLPSDIREAWEQLQSAKQFRYPSGTINNLWKIFEKLAKKRGINPMSVTAKLKVHAAKMTKQHFIALAKAIARLSDVKEKQMMIDALTPMLVASNPNFDMDRFKKASGLG